MMICSVEFEIAISVYLKYRQISYSTVCCFKPLHIKAHFVISFGIESG